MCESKVRPSVYLSGAMEGCTDQEATAWRERAKCLLKGPIRDPVLSEDVRLQQDLTREELATLIVEDDVAEIMGSDVILADFSLPNKKYIGTSMEVRIAWDQGKIIVAVSPEFHPWLYFHADAVFAKLEDACEFINRM